MTNDAFKINSEPKSINKFDEQINNTKKVCDELAIRTEAFEKFSVIKIIEENINKNNRFLYSEISNYIFSLPDSGIIHTNISALADYVFSEEYLNIDIEIISEQKKDEIQKTVLKLWDHTNLAERQRESLKQDDADFSKSFKKNMDPYEIETNKRLTTYTKETTAQLISLVGIFTAMSFLVFGGINSLDNIFEGALNIPIMKLMIIGCVWGLCIVNLIFVFMFFVSKMTDLNIKSDNRPDINLVKKYPLVIWSDFVICIVLIASVWCYSTGTIEIFKEICDDNFVKRLVTFFIGATIITYSSCTLARKIIEKYKE